jgi:hypothetical protein
MAEAAAVVQFLDFAIKIVSILYGGIETVVQAPRHVQSLSREVRIAKDTLLSARRALEGVSIPPNHPVSSIEELIESGEKYNKSLELAVQGLQQGDGIRRVRWIFEKNKCEALETQVKQHYEHACRKIQLLVKSVLSPPS